MSYFVAKIKGLFGMTVPVASSDPVYAFFFETSAENRKKVYDRALKKAQSDQERITTEANKKIRA